MSSITVSDGQLTQADYQLFEKLKPCIEDKITIYVTALFCTTLPIGSAILGIGIHSAKVVPIITGSLLLAVCIASTLFILQKFCPSIGCQTKSSDLERGPDTKLEALLPPPEDAHFF